MTPAGKLPGGGAAKLQRHCCQTRQYDDLWRLTVDARVLTLAASSGWQGRMPPEVAVIAIKGEGRSFLTTRRTWFTSRLGDIRPNKRRDPIVLRWTQCIHVDLGLI